MVRTQRIGDIPALPALTAHHRTVATAAWSNLQAAVERAVRASQPAITIATL